MKTAIKKLSPGKKDDDSEQSSKQTEESKPEAPLKESIKPKDGNMKAVRVVGYHENLKLDEVEQPKIDGPLDVIVKIGAAGGEYLEQYW